MGVAYRALVIGARIGGGVVPADVLHHGHLLRRLPLLLRLCAHSLAGLRRGGSTTNGALMTLACGRGTLPGNARTLVCGIGSLIFNAGHALACLNAGARILLPFAVCGAAHVAALL